MPENCKKGKLTMFQKGKQSQHSAFGRLEENLYLHNVFENIFENLQKLSQENCGKWTILPYFSKDLRKTAFKFWRLNENVISRNNLRKVSKILKSFRKKIPKNALGYHIFQEDWHTKLSICPFKRTTYFIGNFEQICKIFECFLKSFNIIAKNMMLAYFSKKSKKAELILCAFGRKPQFRGNILEACRKSF